MIKLSKLIEQLQKIQRECDGDDPVVAMWDLWADDGAYGSLRQVDKIALNRGIVQVDMTSVSIVAHTCAEAVQIIQRHEDSEESNRS